MNTMDLPEHAWFASLAYVPFSNASDIDAVIIDARDAQRLGDSLSAYAFRELGWRIASVVLRS